MKLNDARLDFTELEQRAIIALGFFLMGFIGGDRGIPRFIKLSSFIILSEAISIS